MANPVIQKHLSEAPMRKNQLTSLVVSHTISKTLYVSGNKAYKMVSRCPNCEIVNGIIDDWYVEMYTPEHYYV